jgi:hypothetical protein
MIGLIVRVTAMVIRAFRRLMLMATAMVTIMAMIMTILPKKVFQNRPVFLPVKFLRAAPSIL